MQFSFDHFSNPEFLAEIERKENEKRAREAQMIAWRKITAGATGHRSDRMGGYANALGGYNRNHPKVIMLRRATLETMEDLIVNKGITRFISGGALGYDTLFFWCVNHLKSKYPYLENVLAVPFLNQYTAWEKSNPIAVEWYHKMVEAADTVIDVARDPDYCSDHGEAFDALTDEEKENVLNNFSKEKMFKRNDYMVDQLGYLMAFLEEPKSGTGHAVRRAMKGVLNRPSIIRLDPKNECKPEYM